MGEEVGRRLGEIYYALAGKGRPTKGEGGAFTGFQSLWAAAKAAQPPIPGLTQAKARAWYRSQSLSQRLKTFRRRPLVFRHFHFGLDPGVWMSIDNLNIPAKYGPNRFKFSYVGIDLVSKLVAIHFTNKLASTSAIDAVNKFMQSLKFPNGHFTLLSDWGSEFRSANFQTFLQQRSIRHLLTNPLSPNKSALNERVIRTLRGITMRQIKAREQDDVPGQLAPITYREALEHAVQIYNSSGNQSLGGRAPNAIDESNVGAVLVEKEERRAAALDRYVTRVSGGGESLDRVVAALPSEARLAEGTHVRVLLAALSPSDPAADPSSRFAPANSFRKEYAKPTFSSQVYLISGIKNTGDLVSYRVSTVDRSFTFPFSFTENQLSVVPNGRD